MGRGKAGTEAPWSCERPIVWLNPTSGTRRAEVGSTQRLGCRSEASHDAPPTSSAKAWDLCAVVGAGARRTIGADPDPRGWQVQDTRGSRDDLVQVVLDHEMTWWLKVSRLAFELLLPPPSFSASGVCAFQFVTLEHFVRSTRIVIYGHVKARLPITRSQMLPALTPHWDATDQCVVEEIQAALRRRAVLRHVNAAIGKLFHFRIPSLLMRARAQATVRVWKKRLEHQAHSRSNFRDACGLPVATRAVS